VLRRFVPEDRDGFVEMNRDPGVRKYFPGLLTLEESLGEMTESTKIRGVCNIRSSESMGTFRLVQSAS
jgi:hypothetical protein